MTIRAGGGLAAAATGLLCAVSAAPALAAAGPLTKTVESATQLVRVGSAAPFPAGAKVLATSAAAVSSPMAVTVTLKPRHAAQLNDYAAAVENPGSRLYRDYLSAGQFRARYAPTKATIRKVESQMRSRGLTVRGVTADRLGIELKGSGSELEHAFSLNFQKLRLSDGKTALIDAEAPALAKSIAPAVSDVVGLNGLETVTSSLNTRTVRATGRAAATAQQAAVDSKQPRTDGPYACKAARSAETSNSAASRGAYTMNQVASYYGISGVYKHGDRGKGVTVALYELEHDNSGDIAAYQKCYGTHAKISYQKVDGGPTGKKNGDGGGEAALDIEQLIGVAPRVHLIVYQGRNSNADAPGSGPYDTFAKIVGQDRAAVISNSWGECEAAETYQDAAQEDTLFKEAAVQGQTMVSAAGDSGSEDCYGLTADGSATLAVDDPGSQPWVTAVGGTSLSLASSPTTETVWNDTVNANADYEAGAGGGGLSDFWAMPDYQSSAPATLGVINTESSAEAGCGSTTGHCREVPDVSASADPADGYMSYYNGNHQFKQAPSGWQGVGGTSAAAPLWAGLFALADANKSCGGSRIGFADPALYRLAGSGQTKYFHDITSGNNDFTGEALGMFPATTGYDMATGLGSPRAGVLIPALCGQAIHVSGARTRSYRVGARIKVEMKARAPQGAGSVTWHSRHLPAGIKFNAKTGTLSGKFKRAGSTGVVITATADGNSAKVPAGYYGAREFTWTVKRRRK